MPRFTNPVPQYNYIDPISSEFGPLKEGKLYFFESQTNTPLTTYKDAFLTIPNTHPVILDAGGNVPNVFFEGTARVVLTDQNDVQQWERDPVGGENEFGQLSLWQPTVEYGSNDYVIGSDGKIYKSRNASNTGNDPTTSPNDWLEQEFLGVWNNTFPYAIGNIVRTSTGNLWKSLTANNLTNDPETDSGTNWTPAVDGSKIPEIITAQQSIDDITTVIPQTGGGALTAKRTNELRDGSTYTLPLASSVSLNQTIRITLPDEFKSFQPLIQRSGSDTISYSGGTDTEILFVSGSQDIELTSDGVSNWGL